MEGRFNGGFFALPVWGGLYLEGLIQGGAYFRNFTVLCIFFQDRVYVGPKGVDKVYNLGLILFSDLVSFFVDIIPHTDTCRF